MRSSSSMAVASLSIPTSISLSREENARRVRHLALTLGSLGILTSFPGVAVAAAVEGGQPSSTLSCVRALLQIRPVSCVNPEPRAVHSRGQSMTERRRTSASTGQSSKKAIKVPGGWKLPDDDTVYPYNPLVPPDMVDPVPPPPGRDRR